MVVEAGRGFAISMALAFVKDQPYRGLVECFEVSIEFNDCDVCTRGSFFPCRMSVGVWFFWTCRIGLRFKK